MKFLNDDDAFIGQFFPGYYQLVNQVNAMQEEVDKRDKYHDEFENWRKAGEIIEADFIKIEVN